MIDRILLEAILLILRVVRRLLQSEPRLFAMLGRPAFQPVLAWVGRAKAWQVYRKARQDCPAYAQFLADQHAPPINRPADWSQIPNTTKENYVKKFDIEARCYGGHIPSRGVVIDESSGSSGIPNSWVRGAAERGSVKAIMQLSYSLMFESHDFFILNCFALGPWATESNVSMSLVDVAIMKSMGPDKAKLENAIKQFGPKYRYLKLLAIHPLSKTSVDTTTLDLININCT